MLPGKKSINNSSDRLLMLFVQVNLSFRFPLKVFGYCLILKTLTLATLAISFSGGIGTKKSASCADLQRELQNMVFNGLRNICEVNKSNLKQFAQK